MKPLLLFSWICLSLTIARGALPSPDSDTTHTYQVAEVVITVTRSLLQSKDSPSPVQVLSAEEIQSVNGSSISDVLRSTGSIFLKDRGPAASLKTISFRGMASEHILVLLDGVRINSMQNGLVDFSLLPMKNVDRIEVVRGGNSALYGADALGGVINIITGRPTETFQLQADASFGSFDYRQFSLEARGRIGGIGLVAGVMRDRSIGDYPFLFQRPGLPDTTRRREGADFERTQIYFNGDYQFDGQSMITLSLQRVKTDQGVPGSLTFASRARQEDDAVTAVTSLRDIHLNRFVFSANFGLSYNLENISFLDFPFTYYSKTTLSSINPQVQWIVNSWDHLIVGAEFVEGRLEGMVPGSLIKRIQRSVYISNEMIFQRESSILDRLSLYQTLRYDDLSEGYSASSPKIGLNLRILRDWDTRFRASFSKNFRMPTFNDLYDPWLSNPALKPEHSECFDMGVETELDRLSVHTLQVTYFSIETRDRILPNAFYFPVNIAQAQNRGVEGRYEFRPPAGEFQVYADFTMNDAIRHNGTMSIDSTEGKQLLYTPKFICALGASVQTSGLRFTLTHTITSKRYISEDESISLPAYSLTDFNVSASVHIGRVRSHIRAEASNVFDGDYQVIKDYPMPGRTFRLALGFEY